MTPQERLIATAEDQVGYLGKKSNAQLDDFKANTSGKWNNINTGEQGDVLYGPEAENKGQEEKER